MLFIMVVSYAFLCFVTLFGIEAWEGWRNSAGKRRWWNSESPFSCPHMAALFWPIFVVTWLSHLGAVYARGGGKKLYEVMLERALKKAVIKGTGRYRDPLRCGNCDSIIVDERSAKQ